MTNAESETVQSFNIDDQTIISEKEIFGSLVYTSWEDARVELRERRTNARLSQYVDRVVPNGIPEIMRDKQSMVLFRHIATGNYETARFLDFVGSEESIQPLILEYNADKFTNRNESKFFLGKLHFNKGVNKHKQVIFENINIIDVNASNNRPISTIHTSWSQTLVEFHHELFHRQFPQYTGSIEDISQWLHEHGPSAKEYYKAFFSLFLKDAILFENFLTQGKELSFTQEVVLPAIHEIIAETGFKPLIVALEPLVVEEDQYWLSYPIELKSFVDEKMHTKGQV